MAGSKAYWMMGHRHTPIPTIGDWGLIHIEWGPGLPGPPRHYQERSSEFFYVLSGRLDLGLDRKWHSLGPRESLSVDKGVVVEMRNGSDAEVVLLMGFSPRGFERFIAENGIPDEEPNAFDVSHSAEVIRQLVTECGNYGMAIPELGIRPPETDSTGKQRISSDASDAFFLMGHRMRPLPTLGDFSLVEITATPDVAGPPLHSDQDAAEFYYVLEGKLELVVDDAWRTLGPGESLCVPAGAVHGRAKTTDPGVTWLTGWSPRGFERLLEECGVPAESPNAMEESLSSESVARLVERAPEFGMVLPAFQEPRWPEERPGARTADKQGSRRRREADEKTDL